jgi:gamma-glutamylaminecyclotransferase
VLQDNLVATYGTLKKGESNHHYVKTAKYVGRGKTSDKYPLVIDGLPYLYKEKGVGYNVEVDIFKVSDARLERMDALEGHPRWYKREQVDIELNGKTLKCWVYFMTNPRNKHRVLHKSFSRTHVSKFKPLSRFTNEVEEVVQTSFFDDYSLAKTDEQESPYCLNCFHDLDYDGFSHYHCNSCDSWFTKAEVESSI